MNWMGKTIRFFLVALLLAVTGTACSGRGRVEEPSATLTYMGNAQFLLVTPGGTRIMSDVYSSGNLVAALGGVPVGAQDVLLTTHHDVDHINRAWTPNFPGIQRDIDVTRLELPDAIVYGVEGWQSEPDEQFHVPNVSFVIETAGLRIVQFGDESEAVLSEEQLAALGRVDVALMNAGYGPDFPFIFTVENRRFLNLVDQIQPRLIILTHCDLAHIEAARELYPCYYTGAPIVLSPAELPETRTILLVGKDEGVALEQNGLQAQLRLPLWADR